NCCIYLDDDTMLEPLAIAHRETCEAAALAGNTFVRNDQTFRFRRGDEGFSHVVGKSGDAAVDHAMFERLGMSGGGMVDFSRKFSEADGKGEVSVELAFATDPRAPDAPFFVCEDVVSDGPDRSALRKHKNGAVGIAEVVIAEPNPSDFQYFLQTFFDQREVEADSFGISLDLGGSTITALTPDGLQAHFAMDGERTERGMRFFGFVIGVSDLSATRILLKRNDVSFSERLGKLVVPPAEGQGCMIAFQEVQA
ncbi:MAG: VOC family protein, partial [Pseudomonadota bacterium]